MGSETGAILLLVLMGLSLLGSIVGLPGTIIAFLMTLVYGWATGFAEVTGRLLLILLVVAVAAEGADQVLGIWAARRYGASLKGILGSVLGAILGAILLGGILPIVGGVIGAFVGAYVGALLVERQVTGEWPAARRAAWGGFLGRVAGILVKLIVGVAMILLVWRAVF